MRMVCTAAMATILVLVSQDASAQTRNDETRRTALIQQATQARSQGRWSAVAELLQQVIEIRATASVRLGLAGALQELGRYQEAATQATLCMQTASTDRDLREEQRTALVDGCGQVLRDSTANLASVTVEVSPEGVTGTTLSVDGEPVEGFAAGRPFYLTPGRRRFALAAPEYRSVEVSETLRAGVSRTVRMHLARQEVHAPQLSPLTSSQTASASMSPWLLSGAGVLAVGFGLVAILGPGDSARDERAEICRLDSGSDTRCPNTSQVNELQSRYETWHYMGIASVAAGSGLIIGGLLWGLLRPSSARSANRPVVSLGFQPHGLLLRGAW
jgi:hypothetical protein